MTLCQLIISLQWPVEHIKMLYKTQKYHKEEKWDEIYFEQNLIMYTYVAFGCAAHCNTSPASSKLWSQPCQPIFWVPGMSKTCAVTVFCYPLSVRVFWSSKIYFLLWPNAGWCLCKEPWLFCSSSCWSCQTTGYYLSTVSIMWCELPSLSFGYDHSSPFRVNHAILADTHNFFLTDN